MINGEEYLRKQYEYLDLDDTQFQPNGLDLTVGKVFTPEHIENTMYGLYKDAKLKPELREVNHVSTLVNGGICKVFCLAPHSVYIVETEEKIKIGDNNVQLYFPRSTLLRSCIDVRSCVGDAGFNGHLSFLVENKSDAPFYLEKGVRFAQLLDFQADGVMKKYDGDYQED